MNVGMVCWALVGGQGRYRLATMIASACSLLIMLPIGIYLTLEMRFNLKGLTFAVVVGNSATAMCLTYVLLMSNWEKLSFKVQHKSKVDGVNHSDSISTEESESESENEDTSPKISSVYELSLTRASESSDCEQNLQTSSVAGDVTWARSDLDALQQLCADYLDWEREETARVVGPVLKALESTPAQTRFEI